MRNLRQKPCSLQKVQNLPTLSEETCQRRQNPGTEKGKLVMEINNLDYFLQDWSDAQ